MIYSRWTFACALTLLLTSLPAHADPFTIDLEVKSSTDTKTARAEKVAPGERAKPRAVVEAKAGETLTVKWTLTYAGTQELPNVLVHCFAVQQKSLGQKEVPKLDRTVNFESALTMDFKPKDQASGRFVLKVAKPGFYLLRVETIDEDHRVLNFAAIDVRIE
jgi:hypothetical protein